MADVTVTIIKDMIADEVLKMDLVSSMSMISANG